MSLRELYKHPDYDWMTKAKEMEELALKVAKNLFLFDNFVEKEIDDLENASDQLIYTYTIINLYGLFFDSGKYIKFKNVVFLSTDTETAKKDLLCISEFYVGLQELRSIICHNKPLDSLQRKNLEPLGKNDVQNEGKKAEPVELSNFKHLRKYGANFSYEDAFKCLTKKAMAVLEIISNCIEDISGADEETKKNFVKAWYDSIILWYKIDPAIHYRAANSFFGISPQRVKKYVKSIKPDTKEDEYLRVFSSLIKDDLLSNVPADGSPLDYWKNSYQDHFCNGAIDPRELSPLNAMLDIFNNVCPR